MGEEEGRGVRELEEDTREGHEGMADGQAGEGEGTREGTGTGEAGAAAAESQPLSLLT